jgi:penicillin-binding protein 2
MRRMIRKKTGEIEDYVFSITQEEAAKIERPLSKRKIQIFGAFILLSMLVLSGRTFYLNVIKGKYYQDIAKGNSIRSIVFKAPRGKIYDSRGKLLVNNIPSIDAIFIPAYLPSDKDELQDMSWKLSQIFQINQGEIFAKLNSTDAPSLNPILLKESISQDESLIFSEKKDEFSGVSLQNTAIRQYLDSTIFSHILGYEGKISNQELQSHPDYLLTDYIGKQGIEKTYEKYLKGTDGATQVEVDSKGNVKREIGMVDSMPGDDLILSINADLQKKIYESLNNMLGKTKSKTAAAIAINPQNGKILALVSFPSYDNNLFSTSISQQDYLNLINDPDKPLFNRAISGEYPPGSVIKPLIATAALSEGTITPSTIIDSLGGVLNVGNFSFHDWKAHVASDVRTAIAQSNDIFFYTVGGGHGSIQGLGMDRMKKYEDRFGLGSPLGVDIPGEASGLIPSTQWKLDKIGERWYTGDDYHAAIGQGFVTATPLQLVNYIAAIANGGTLFQPQTVFQMKEPDGKTVDVPSKILNANLASSDIIKVVQEGMRETITGGTAQTLKTLPVEVAGKTGTAQFGTGNQTHGWFVSYAPYDHPTIAMVVLVEGGGEGNSSALPVTQEVYQWYFGEGKNR